MTHEQFLTFPFTSLCSPPVSVPNQGESVRIAAADFAVGDVSQAICISFARQFDISHDVSGVAILMASVPPRVALQFCQAAAQTSELRRNGRAVRYWRSGPAGQTAALAGRVVRTVHARHSVLLSGKGRFSRLKPSVARPGAADVCAPSGDPHDSMTPIASHRDVDSPPCGGQPHLPSEPSPQQNLSHRVPPAGPVLLACRLPCVVCHRWRLLGAF